MSKQPEQAGLEARVKDLEGQIRNLIFVVAVLREEMDQVTGGFQEMTKGARKLTPVTNEIRHLRKMMADGLPVQAMSPHDPDMQGE
jgi:hypothetical protein